MANTLNLGTDGNWATKEDSLLAYNSENGKIYKPLPFDFTRALSATVVNKDGLIETVGSGEPRIDFSNDAKGALLLEPSRMNLVTYSQDFDNVAWSKSNATPTISSELSPTGALNAYDVVFASGGGYLLESITTTKTIGSSETISVFSKTDVSGTFLKYGGGTASGTDLENKESFGNGWYRYSVTRTFTEAETASTQIIISSAEVGLNVVLFGAQLEQGSYATSYIPTQGSAVTRVADACNNGGNDQVINSTEGVLYAQISALSNSGNTYRLIGLNNGSGTNTNRIFIGYTNNNSIYAAINDTTIAFTTSSFDVKNFNKVAVVYNGSIAKLFINGSEVGSGITNAPTLSGLSRVDFSGSSTGANEFKGNTKDVRVYTTALTDAELQALTRI